MFVVEDELHAEQQGEYQDIESAVAELQRRAEIPWHEEPNIAPCTSWRTCGRMYVIIEYDDAEHPWKELRRFEALEISAAGVKWKSPLREERR